jgi:hypothetical protein
LNAAPFGLTRTDSEREHRARVAAAVDAARDGQFPDERAHDEEAAPRDAHDVVRQQCVVGESRTPVERVQDRSVAADVESEVHLVRAVPNDVAQQFAEDQLRERRIGVGRAAVA